MLKSQSYCLKLTMLFIYLVSISLFAQEYKFYHRYTCFDGNKEIAVSAMEITNDPTHKMPIVIVEGFDQYHKQDKEFTHDSIQAMLTATGLKQQWLNDGYSIFMVNLDDNWDELLRQGYALGNLLQGIHTLKAPYSNEPIKIIGFSQGGLVSTIACGIKQCYLQNPSLPKQSFEQNYLDSWTFKVDLLVTWDSPHQGAFMETSVQELCFFLRNKSDVALNAFDAFCSKAVLQQFIVNGTNVKTVTNDFTTRPDFVEKYNLIMYSIPHVQGIRYVSVTNGSWGDISQSSDYYDNDLFYLYYFKDGPFGYYGVVETRLNVQIPYSRYFYGRIDIKKPGPNEYYKIEISSQSLSNPEIFLLGNAPGGFRTTFQTLKQAVIDKGYGTPTTCKENHCFVPTFSAAGLDFNTFYKSEKWNLADLEQTMGPMENYSPFDKIYHHTGPNQEHVRGFSGENIGWIKKEIAVASRPDITPIINLLLDE